MWQVWSGTLVRSMPLMPVSVRATPLKSAPEPTETHYGYLPFIKRWKP
jgi:hypothetical protein